MLVIKDFNDEDQTKLEIGLTSYDFKITEQNNNKKIIFGYYNDEKLVGGITAKLEGYKILYIETLFVKEDYRNLGIGTKLVRMMEEQSVFEGVKMIRLDTFSWQALGFYQKLGYEVATSYEICDNYYEYILIKRLKRYFEYFLSFLRI